MLVAAAVPAGPDPDADAPYAAQRGGIARSGLREPAHARRRAPVGDRRRRRAVRRRRRAEPSAGGWSRCSAAWARRARRSRSASAPSQPAWPSCRAPTQEARSALECIVGDGGGVVALPRLSPFGYLALRADDTARRLVDPRVREFLDEDRARGGVLTATIRAFADADLNVNAAAEQPAGPPQHRAVPPAPDRGAHRPQPAPDRRSARPAVRDRARRAVRPGGSLACRTCPTSSPRSSRCPTCRPPPWLGEAPKRVTSKGIAAGDIVAGGQAGPALPRAGDRARAAGVRALRARASARSTAGSPGAPRRCARSSSVWRKARARSRPCDTPAGRSRRSLGSWDRRMVETISRLTDALAEARERTLALVAAAQRRRRRDASTTRS